MLKNEHIEKDLIEKDKSIFNYREELRLLELRFSEMAVSESRNREEAEAREKSAKFLKEIEKVTSLYK